MPRLRLCKASAGAVASSLALAFATGCGTDSGQTSKPASIPAPVGIERADKRLRALYAEANELLPGGRPAYRRRIAELKGLPIVVNKWASWCGPCEAEFPWFRSQATKLGAKVAFLGVDTNDARDDAREFLDRHKVPFPTYEDPRAEIAADMKNVISFPATAFYDADGRLTYVHQGQFQDEAQLAQAIRKYAMASPASR
jgi:thiol-disulfide isomerase/thioredoxin